MRSHLHPRSRSTVSLFSATLLASFLVVGIPHAFPCPAPRRMLADSTHLPPQSIARKSEREKFDPTTTTTTTTTRVRADRNDDATSQVNDDKDQEVLRFRELEAEAKAIREITKRECPVPKPGAIIGRLLGSKDTSTSPSTRPKRTNTENDQ